jgi:hypothetical protein
MDAPVAQPAPKTSLFGSKPAVPTVDLSEVQQDINSLSTRLRIGEERYNDLRRQLQFIEQQSMSNQKKAMGELKMLNGEVTEVKHSISELQNRMILLIKELQLMAKKSDVDVLRKYLDFWEPVKFVNAGQVEKIVKDEIESARQKDADSEKPSTE